MASTSNKKPGSRKIDFPPRGRVMKDADRARAHCPHRMISMPALLLLLAVVLTPIPGHAASWQYFRLGSKSDVQTQPIAGTAMMGGGSDLDEAFRWLCLKGNGGDFLVLSASGTDDYNPYVNGLCKLNSVATLILPDQAAAQDPAVAEIIKKAEVIFISGGDQAHYIRAWQGTPVEEAINAHVAAGKPIGGTSAGLAVEGEFVYGAVRDKPDGNDQIGRASCRERVQI